MIYFPSTSCYVTIICYIYSMITSNHQNFIHNNQQTLKAVTPDTAESLILQSLPIKIHEASFGKQFYDFCNQEAVFQLLQQNQPEENTEVKQHKSHKDSIKSFVQEDIEDCQFKIRINIKNQNQEILKHFTKPIIKSIQNSQGTTLIFDRQHEKIKLQENLNYGIEVFLETEDGFSRAIWKQNFKISRNFKVWEVLTIFSQREQQKLISLNIEVEKLGKYYIKPLSIKMPLSTIDDFFGLKLKLLNKSEILNDVESVGQLKGILLSLTKQNMGSRIIQKLLTKSNQNQIQEVIIELKPHFKDMIFDRYGNYVFQKIFKVANSTQREICFKRLQPSLIDLLQSKEGTHSIQFLVDHLPHQEVSQKFSKFTPEQIVQLSTNRFSMHFIQKIVPFLPQEYLFPIIINNFKTLSVDKHGIVVLKAVINFYASTNFQTRYQILTACQNYLPQISFTQYGHYIIEELFKYYNYYELQNILSYIISYTSFFSLNQYSSSILRKCIDAFKDYASIPFILSILKEGLPQMMQNPSGQFILHRLMQLTMDQYHKNLLITQMITLSKSVKCYEKKQKWYRFFKLV